MSKVKVTLTPNVARAILMDIAEERKSSTHYDKWEFWSRTVEEGTDFLVGNATVRLVQAIMPTENPYGESSEGETELIFSFQVDTEEAQYFRLSGDYTSYSGQRWNGESLREVRPTKVVRQVFEYI